MATDPSDSFAEVFTCMGAALNSWSQLEDMVFIVYMSCISARNADAARLAYFAIVAFEAKLAATDAAAKSALVAHATHLAEWSALQSQINKKRKIRNKIAHSQILHHRDQKHARLFPFYSVTDRTFDWNGGWKASQLIAFRDDIAGLCQKLSDLTSKLRSELGMWPTDWRPTP